MKIVVLGGAGFLGSELLKLLLSNGHEVVIGDERISELFPEISTIVDVREASSLGAIFKGADVVINLAAVHRDDVRPVSLYYEVNVGGAEAVCQAATESGVSRLLFTSSVAIYGTTAADEICGEDRSPDPFNDYGQSKLEAEGIYRSWADESPNRQLIVVRPTVIFGRGNRGNVYNLMKQVAEKRFLMIGDGENRKSIAYVENVSAFLVHCLGLKGRNEVFNYVDGPDMTVARFVEVIRETLGRKSKGGIHLPYWLGHLAGGLLDFVARVSGRTFPISRVRVMKFCANTRFDRKRALDSGFRAPVPLEEGVRRTVESEFGELIRR